MASVAKGLALLSIFAAAIGCTTDHDLLAAKPNQQGGGGAPGDGGADESFPTNPRNDAAPIDAGDPEPAGPWLLTLLNGVVDLETSRFCFVPSTDEGELPPDEPPLPEGPGIAFGSYLVLSSLGAFDLATTDVHAYLIIGASGANARISCRQVVQLPPPDAARDGGPDLPIALSLGMIPARTLAEPRSYLAAVSGCAHGWPTAPASEAGPGGDAGVDADAGGIGSDGSSICGSGLGTASAGLSLVRLSRRIDFAKLGFQTMNASNAASPASLLVSQTITQNSIYSSAALDTGQIAPRAQPAFVAKSAFGAGVGSASLQVVPPAGSTAFSEFESDFATVLAMSQFAASDLTEGNNYTFVLLGAQPGQEVPAPFHPFRLAFVANAPEPANLDASVPRIAQPPVDIKRGAANGAD